MWHIRTLLLLVPQTLAEAVGHDAGVRLVGFTVVGFLVLVCSLLLVTGERVGFLALLGLPWPSALKARHATVSPNNSFMVSWCNEDEYTMFYFRLVSTPLSLHHSWIFSA